MKSYNCYKIICLIGVICFLFGCEKESKQFEIAKNAKSIIIIDQYLKKYPNAPYEHIDTIRQVRNFLLNDSLFYVNILATKDTIERYELEKEYVKNNKNGVYFDKVKRLLHKDKSAAEALEKKLNASSQFYFERIFVSLAQKERIEDYENYFKLENVKDLSFLANSSNIIPEAKKFTAGNQYIVKTNFIFMPPAVEYDNFALQGGIEIIEFGEEGRTVLFYYYQKDGNKIEEYTFTLSGKDVYVTPTVLKDLPTFVIFKGKKAFASLMRAKATDSEKTGMTYYWVPAIINEVPGLINNFYRGQTRAQVEAICGRLGLSSFKETGKTNKYTISSLFWVDIEKQYDIFDDYHYQMRTDKKYGDFYFNAEGKLMKWFLYL